MKTKKLKICFWSLLFVFYSYCGIAQEEIKDYHGSYFPERLASIYFKGKVYLFSRDYFWGKNGALKADKRIRCKSFNVKNDGRPDNYAEHHDVANQDECEGTSLCACEYNGKLYVFYDYIIPTSDYKIREIRYKTNTDPQNSNWEPAGGKFATLMQNVKFGNDEEKPLFTAAVLNNKLYLFYAKRGESTIHVKVFDGQKWEDYGNVCSYNHKFYAISAQSVLTTENSPVIAIAIKTQDNILWIELWKENKGPRVLSYPCYNVPAEGDMQAVFGGGNVLQVFTNKKIYSYEIGDNLVRLTGNVDERILEYAPDLRATTAVATYVPENNKDIKGYITYFTARKRWDGINVDTRKSCYLKFIKSEKIETLSTQGSNFNPAWTLLGVVEGVPPFSRNKELEYFAPTSKVIFSKEKTESSSVSSNYSQSLSTSVGLDPKLKGIGGFSSLSSVIAKAHGVIETFKKDIEHTFDNTKGNHFGSFGFFIFEKPTFCVNQYTRFTVDGVNLGDFVFTYVSNVDLTFEEYELENPPLQGMKIVKETCVDSAVNEEFWRSCPHESDGDDLYGIVNLLKESIRGGETSIRIFEQASEAKKDSFSSQVELHLASIIGGAASSLSFAQESEHTASFGTGFSISASIVEPKEYPPPPRTILSMEMRPHLLKPKDGIPKASWIPDMYKNNKPWILTWQILKIERATGPSPKPSASVVIQMSEERQQ